MRHRLYALTTLLLLAALPARAENWYQVELIVFARGGEYLDAEQWPEQPPLPDLGGAVTLQAPGSGDPAFRSVPAAELKLAGTWGSLTRSRGFEPLLHVGWRQPGLERGEAVPVALSEGEPPRLFGTVTVSLARYLHLDARLAYQLPWTEPEWYVLDGSLRMRSGELHYLDHPLFGVVAQITPWEPPAPAADATPAPAATAGAPSS